MPAFFVDFPISFFPTPAASLLAGSLFAEWLELLWPWEEIGITNTEKRESKHRKGKINKEETL